MDKETREIRIAFVNKALSNALSQTDASLLLLKILPEFAKINLDADTSVEIACFFTNVDGRKGELETLLKAIKPNNQVSNYADCLEHWRNCVNR